MAIAFGIRIGIRAPGVKALPVEGSAAH